MIEMHRKYAGKGLAVISLSLDDPTDKAAVAEAEKFLKEKKAVCTNVLLDESFGEGFEKLQHRCDPSRLCLRSGRQRRSSGSRWTTRTTSSLTTKWKRLS